MLRTTCLHILKIEPSPADRTPQRFVCLRVGLRAWKMGELILGRRCATSEDVDEVIDALKAQLEELRERMKRTLAR
ncbi:MAG TPA: hypothetical protein VGO90_06115 [Chthoniobacteraceae bacterium]|jgi:hypothetical protein|nr:hypothetical protein [Chthoniobacteraceae bacterium]